MRKAAEDVATIRNGKEFIMKIKKIGDARVIMSNPHSHHAYFGWPTAARLADGRIAVSASGFRIAHVCPFGKTVISYSDDDGESYSLPAPVIDTPLDDRDGGITPFGENGILISSFNNTVNFQRTDVVPSAYASAYLDTVTDEEEKKYLGSTFRTSRDGGKSFGEIYKSPITSPHGPTLLSDGRLLWVGRTFSPNDAMTDGDCIQLYEVDTADFSMRYISTIDSITEDGVRLLSCEPAMIELPDGRLLVHVRVQTDTEDNYFTLYQTVSEDGGKSWSRPRPILPRRGGAPSHIMMHSSGVLVATYGHREEPYGIRAMFSHDGGESWDVGYELFCGPTRDLGYPSTVELADGSMITVFYTHETADGPAVIMQQKWRFEE